MSKYRLETPHDDSELEFLRAALSARDWIETTGHDWDLLWSFEIPRHPRYRSLRPGQLVNHFPGSLTLHAKDELAHHLAVAGADFHPRTFSMPGDEAAWRSVAASEPGSIWIVKEKRMAEGFGTRLTRDPTTVEADPDVIVQEYIADPLLLPGESGKHTLRVYVAVMSFEPLSAFVYPNGPVKFTSRPYGLSDADLADPVKHLTNPTVQRINQDVANPVRSIDMPEYRRRLTAAGHDPDALWAGIGTVLRETLCAHQEPAQRVSRNVTDQLDGCFELLGFDILVDASLQPWVIECNVSPALGARGAPGSSHRAAQRRAKRSMVTDLMGLVLEGIPGAFDPLFPQ